MLEYRNRLVILLVEVWPKEALGEHNLIGGHNGEMGYKLC